MRDQPSLYDVLLAFFAGEAWKHTPAPEQRAVSFVFEGAAGPWTTHAKAFEDERQIAVYGVLPFTIDEPRRAAAAELITRINYGLVIGNYEMDFTDGEVRYKTSLDVEGAALTDALLLQLVRANLVIMDSYLPAFVALVARELGPREALAVVE